MTALREDIVHRLPKLVSNLALAVVFWVSYYVVLVALSPINAEQAFLLHMGLLIVSGIFVVRALFNTLTIADRLTGSFLKRLGIKEGLSRERILKDTICIVGILLVAAALYPLFNLVSNFEQTFQQIITYFTLGLILLFVFDIGRSFYRITESKANSVAKRFSNLIIEDEKTVGK